MERPSPPSSCSTFTTLEVSTGGTLAQWTVADAGSWVVFWITFFILSDSITRFHIYFTVRTIQFYVFTITINATYRSRWRLQAPRVFHLLQHDSLHRIQRHFDPTPSPRAHAQVWASAIQSHHFVHNVLGKY